MLQKANHTANKPRDAGAVRLRGVQMLHGRPTKWASCNVKAGQTGDQLITFAYSHPGCL